MKRNIIRTGLLCCLLLGLFAFGGAALADNGQQQLPKPGILPDSPWYFLDKLGKDIGLFFTFGNQAKAEKALRYAGERLAEAQAMKAKGKDTQMADAARGYEKYLEQVQNRLQDVSDNGTSGNLSERVALAAGFHLTVLDGLSGNLTGPAAEAIAHALQASVKGQEQALRVLARHRAETALTIAGDTINAHLEQLRNRVEAGFSGNVTGQLDIAEQLSLLENQLTAAAEQQGIDVTAVREQLAQATSQRLSVLSQVYEKAPERAKQAISNAVGNSFELYQRAIDRLSSGNVTDNLTGSFSGNFTLSQPLLNHLSSTIRERLGLGSGNLTPLAPPGHATGDHNP